MDKQQTYECKVLSQALEQYGEAPQITMMFEEMSELQKELCKHLRGQGNENHIAEEIADVEIVLEQMKLLFNCTTLTNYYRQKKLHRLEERLREDANKRNE